MNSSPMTHLSALGQSVWIDFLSRESIREGHLQHLIDEDSVVGATSNPTIFQKAMTAGNAYDEQLRKEAGRGSNVRETFWGGAGRDGYVSLEVDPGLAYDTLATYREAIRLHKAVDRPNLMVKIPATKPGLAAIEDVIAKGHSINVTLIFSLQRYADVAESYTRGIERLIAAGGDPSTVASVASFFVSRIDTEADRRLDELNPARVGGISIHELKGKLAIANAKLAYQHYKRAFTGERWEYLAGKGATPQRVLWASTSTKNPAYRDTMYVEELIGADTVNTMPEETISDFQDHGKPAPRLEQGVAQAKRLLQELAAVGVDYDDLTDTLEREGVEKFSASFDELLGALGEKQAALA
jgi:transaldolase